MNWTIGIITTGNEICRLNTVIESIIGGKNQIIVVGGKEKDISFLGIDHISFDENQRNGWITRKKNLITENAQYENICFLHDYISLCDGWFEGFEKFGDNWLTCINKILNYDGKRYRDWCEIYNDSWMEPAIDNEKPPRGDGKLIDYSQRCCERWQYYSGAYFCAKRSVMRKIPFDETRVWAQGEDVQWSRLVYKEYGPSVFQFNPYSTVRFLKQKQHAPWE